MPELPIDADQAVYCGLVAAFVDYELFDRAARAIKDEGWEWQAYSPVAEEEFVRQMLPVSRATHNSVRLWTLLGGLTGTTAAFSMTIWMSSNWPLVVGGKPIVSWPPFICVAFEMTVLLGSICCVVGLLINGRLPALWLPAAFQPEFLRDRFGLFIACPREKVAELEHRLLAQGADETWIAWDTPRGRLELAPPARERTAQP